MDQRQAPAGSGRKGGRRTAPTSQHAQLNAEMVLLQGLGQVLDISP